MTSFLPLKALTRSDFDLVRQLLAPRPLFRLYFEAGVDALQKGQENRSILIGGACEGLVLSIDFSGLTVRTLIGALTDAELAEAVHIGRPAELHLEPQHLAFARRHLGSRVAAEKWLRYYRLDTPSGFGRDRRCRLLTAADLSIVEALVRSYPTTIFSAWMLDGAFMGLFEGGELRSCGGVVVESRSLRLANLGNFLTHPQWRGHGFAGAVAKSLIHKLEHDGYRTFLLATTEDNKPARHIYEALGFRVFEERPQLNVSAPC